MVLTYIQTDITLVEMEFQNTDIHGNNLEYVLNHHMLLFSSANIAMSSYKNYENLGLASQKGMSDKK